MVIVICVVVVICGVVWCGNSISHIQENQKLVHRDLAARNVLIESDKLVKISDFGLSRGHTKSDYYYSSNLKELPIFW